MPGMCLKEEACCISRLAMVASPAGSFTMTCAGGGIVMASSQLAVRQDLLWVLSMGPWAA
jgi:hypothetical protein